MKELSTFQLPDGQTAVISAVGLLEGEQLIVQYLACVDCENADWIDYTPCGQVIMVDQYYNPVSISLPGYYRVVSDGDVGAAVRICVQRFGATK